MAKQGQGLPAGQAGTRDKREERRDKGQEKKPSTVNSQPASDSKDKQKKKLQREFDELEKKIATLKDEKTKAETALADPAVYSDKVKFQEAEKKYKELTNQLSPLESKYEELFEQLMKFDS